MILTDYTSFPPHSRGGILCIGNFDGVHLGHAAMLQVGRTLASQLHIPFTIMTFDPHPSLILKPDTPRPPLTTTLQRQELLQAFHPDVLLLVPTTREFLSITAEAFLADVVQRTIGATQLVEGPTFTFGRGAKGTLETLHTLGPSHGFATTIVPTQQVALSDLSLVNVSSSLIRWLLERGRVDDATKCLGRPYALRGQVVSGQKRGKHIGFPTANVATDQLLPGPGVYAGRALLPGPNRPAYRAAISVGTNPTFHGQLTTVEAFLLDFDADLYGQTLQVEFHHWIREMLPFAGIPQLVTQMNRDVQRTRQTISLKESA